MLRLVNVKWKHPSPLDKYKEDGQKDVMAEVTFAGMADEYASCIMELSMKERATDEQLLADGRKLIYNAICGLKTDMETEWKMEPTEKPAPSGTGE